MNDRYFLDTNLFVYAFDRDNLDKQARANELIKIALAGRAGCISFQVIQEFINVATRKFETPLSMPDCEKYLHAVLAPLCEVFPSIEFYVQSLEIVERWQFSYYDALIVTAALQAKCRVLYSEDLHHGQKIQDLTIQNPFKP